jgi:hypothetical protein
MTDPHIHENDYDDGNTADYTTMNDKEIPFDERFMKLDDVLSTDYQVTDQELADHDAAEAGNTGMPLRLEEFKDFAARREAEEHYIKEEIRKKAQEKGVSSHGATKVFKLYKLKHVKENIMRMMAFYESNRRHLYGISKGQQPPVGTENEDVRYYIKLLYCYRRGIKEMQRELRRREEELRTEDFR